MTHRSRREMMNAKVVLTVTLLALTLSVNSKHGQGTGNTVDMEDNSTRAHRMTKITAIY